MGRTKFKGQLSDEERATLQRIASTGVRSAREIMRCRILLLSDQGFGRRGIADVLGCSASTVDSTRSKWENDGCLAALKECPRSGRPPVLDGIDEAKVVAVACSDPPQGFAKWTTRLLASELEKQRFVSRTVSRNTVWRLLRRQKVKPWKKRSTGASPI